MKNLNNIFLSLGSNIDNRENNLSEAVVRLQNYLTIVNISSLYESEPLLYENQGNFLNMMIEVKFDGTPHELLKKIKNIEIEMGRVKNFRFGPRNIDIDIIFFRNEAIDTHDLKIPHYDWENRLFVIAPLCEILNIKVDKNLYNISNQKVKNIGKIEL